MARKPDVSHLDECIALARATGDRHLETLWVLAKKRQECVQSRLTNTRECVTMERKENLPCLDE